MEITISSRCEKESSLQPVHCDSIEDMTAAFKSGAKYIEIPDDVWQKYINDCEGIGHLDDPGLPGVNGGDGIDDCESKYEKKYSLRNYGVKGEVGHVGPQVVFECNKTEESPVMRSYNLAVKTGGFQGSFEEYGKMMEGRPKGPTGQSAGPGLVGILNSQ